MLRNHPVDNRFYRIIGHVPQGPELRQLVQLAVEYLFAVRPFQDFGKHGRPIVPYPAYVLERFDYGKYQVIQLIVSMHHRRDVRQDDFYGIVFQPSVSS